MTSSAPESSALSVVDVGGFVDSQPSAILPCPQSTRPQAATKKRTRTSFVWEHMPDPPQTIYSKGEIIYWHCKYCPKQCRESGGTTIIMRHLESHGVIDNRREQQATSQQLSIASAFERGEESQFKRRRLTVWGII